MNSIERVENRLRGKPVDRVPNLNIIMQFAARYINVPYGNYCTDYRYLVEGNIKCCQDFGIDMVSAISDPYRETSGFGGNISILEDDVPRCTDYYIKEYSDVKKLRPIDPSHSERMNDRLNAISLYQQAAKIISSQFDLTFSGPVRIEGTNRIFTLKDQSGNLYYFNYFMQDGTWNMYSETQAEVLSPVLILSQKEKLEQWMLEKEFLLKNADFKVQSETILRWDMEQPDNIVTRTSSFHEGVVMLTLTDDLVPFDFMNTIVEKEYLRKVKIISPTQAFERVLEGEFEIYSPLNKGDKLFISSCEISYIYDTKGYYQPAYRFSGYINDRDHPWSCFIPAISGAN